MNVTVFQVTGTEFTDKQQTRATVERLASSLKKEVNPDMAASIDGRLGELQEKWRSLEEKLSERKTGELCFVECNHWNEPERAPHDYSTCTTGKLL